MMKGGLKVLTSRCDGLRWKGMLIDADHDPTVPESNTRIYWCVFSQSPLGPDGAVCKNVALSAFVPRPVGVLGTMARQAHGTEFALAACRTFIDLLRNRLNLRIFCAISVGYVQYPPFNRANLH